ncbi:MAG: trigger factor [Gemmatimonadaceae bacterium]|nr:trigger factor [Gemmatimonadaceae bacterium]
MNLQVTEKKVGGVERLLQVEVPADLVKQAEDKAVRRYASTARLPGFRPGKAPPAMIRQRFAEAIRQETVDSLIQEAYKQVVGDGDVKLAAQPHVHDVKFAEGQPLTFELHLEVHPEVVLPRTQGFRVTRSVRPVTDDSVQEQIDAVREQHATWAPLDGRPLEQDMVTVTLATAEDDGTIPEGREYRIILGGGQAIPGIEELIMTLAPGETAERPVRWPDDFPDAAQRSKTKVVRVTLTEVKRKSLPDLDDAFAREVGEFETVAALRQAIRDDLESAATREADAEVRQKLIDEIIGANPFEVPPSWVTQMVSAYLQAYQVPESEAEAFTGRFRSLAERQVRRDLVIDTLAEREKLGATESELDDRVAELASRRGTDAGKLYASLQKAGRLKEIERSITEDKVFRWLLAQNTVE